MFKTTEDEANYWTIYSRCNTRLDGQLFQLHFVFKCYNTRHSGYVGSGDDLPKKYKHEQEFEK